MEKKAPKTKRSKAGQPLSSTRFDDADDSNDEITDYGNGLDTTFDDDGHSMASDSGWSSDDDRVLVKKVKATCKDSERINFKNKLKQIDWEEIAFKSFSADDCQKRFGTHVKRVRQFRTLNEIATDIETNINKCPLKKPLNSYQLFIQDQLANVKFSGDFSEIMTNMGTRYKELSPAELAVYKERSKQLYQEYVVLKRQFNAGRDISKLQATLNTTAPLKAKTPYILFSEENKDKIDFNDMRDSYSQLSIDEKYEWVTKAVRMFPTEDVTKFLNKEEQRILKGQLKPSPSAYSLFVKDSYNIIKESYEGHNIFTEIAQRWKSMDSNERKKYTDQATMLKEKTARDQQEFEEKHGLKPLRKRRKSMFVELPPLEDETSDDKLTNSTPAKKRKTSKSIEGNSNGITTKQIELKSPKKEFLKPKSVPQSPIKAFQEKNSAESNSKLKLLSSENETDIAPEGKKVKKKKNRLNSEASDSNAGESDFASSANDTDSSTKKKSKKNKKEKEAEEPGDKPPPSVFQYFAAHVHTGKPHKAQKAFDKLNKKERKQLNAEYNEKVKVYVEKLKIYLSSMSKQDAIKYVEKMKARDQVAQADNDSHSQSSQDD